MKSHYYCFLLCLSACFPVEPVENENAEGYVPLYGEPSRAEIKMLAPITVQNPGKIYLYQNYLLINELNRGIHVYDNGNVREPKALGFIEIIGNTDMTIKDNILYADHMGSLVALKTDDFVTLQELGRLPINNWLAGLPPPSGFHFECIDTYKGIVIGWKKQTLTNPDCYAF